MLDLLREGWEGISAHRVRSLLSTLGILFGVAAVIGILSIGEGARQEQARLIDQMGILNVKVQVADLPEDNQQRAEIRRKSAGLSLRDLEALRAALPNARVVGGLRNIDVTDIVPRPADPRALITLGADPEWLAGGRLTLVRGRPLDGRDEATAAQVCLLGESAARNLFGAESALGRQVRLGRVWLRVVGVFQAVGAKAAAQIRGAGAEGVDQTDRNTELIMPLSTAMQRFDHPADAAELYEIQVTLGSVDEVVGGAALIGRIIERLHRGAPDTKLVVPLKLLEQSQAQQRIFNLVMGLIAGISLLVGGIGIMNIMLASVMERTREIGVRLAVGATPRDIRMLFLSEAAVISLIGGVLGVVAGFVISASVSAATGWATAVGVEAVLLGTVLSMAEGVVFGFIPAQRASKLPPAIAVREVG